MEGKRISQLTPDTSPSIDDYIVTVDGSTTQNKRVDLGSLPVSTAQASEIGAKVSKAGDTMTGNLIIPAPTQPAHATTKSYVDSRTPIYGTGSPNGVVSAPVGSTYIDTNATNDVMRWDKMSGISNTGWIPSGSEWRLGGRFISSSIISTQDIVNIPIPEYSNFKFLKVNIAGSVRGSDPTDIHLQITNGDSTHFNVRGRRHFDADGLRKYSGYDTSPIVAELLGTGSGSGVDMGLELIFSGGGAWNVIKSRSTTLSGTDSRVTEIVGWQESASRPSSITLSQTGTTEINSGLIVEIYYK